MSTIALAATTIERNATSISMNANRSTKPTTGARFDFSSAAWSFHSAVRPVTPAWASGSAPTVSGTIVSRRSRNAAFEAASVPFPAIGTVMFATVPARFVSTVIGSNARPPASARRSSCAIAARAAGVRTLDALTTTFAGSAVPGKACCWRW